MIDAQKIEQLAKQLTEALPAPVRMFKDEAEKALKAVLGAQLQKLDLVTREEFDAQARVLARTREKLEELEKRLDGQ